MNESADKDEPIHGAAGYVVKCQATMKRAGAKITKSRLAVIQCLGAATDALTPRQILGVIADDASTPDIDQVSVYRVLELLVRLGLVHQIHPSGGYVPCSHIDCAEEMHILTHCTQCDQTRESGIPAEMFAPVQWYLSNRLKFAPKEHHLQIDGLCADCRESAAPAMPAMAETVEWHDHLGRD